MRNKLIHSPIHGSSTKPAVIQVKSPGYCVFGLRVPHFGGGVLKSHSRRPSHMVNESILFLYLTQTQFWVIHNVPLASFLCFEHFHKNHTTYPLPCQLFPYQQKSKIKLNFVVNISHKAYPFIKDSLHGECSTSIQLTAILTQKKKISKATKNAVASKLTFVFVLDHLIFIF